MCVRARRAQEIGLRFRQAFAGSQTLPHLPAATNEPRGEMEIAAQGAGRAPEAGFPQTFQDERAAGIACGRKATVNARIDENGRIITHGDQVFLGGNDSYVAMCHKCWVSKIKEQEKLK